ncbi:SDR family NAD(P)-dependent oxidoreductase [Rhodoligotrophos defluvii]|uniref:SDR family NAD(P)-dependent oxidoreductase n=1 Tax=Rhodoligotrophos defluvii TaxID=2561934 RepID=UPI0010CA0ECC|nr:SDR family NAD(P)-dependent oxidoreductase [Rhodoligotrophos defluvii]
MAGHDACRDGALTLTARRVLVTGGAWGLGLAIARLAQACGAEVAIMDLDGHAAEAAACSIGGGVISLAGDVSQEADCENAISTVIERLGGLDVLVNSAGIAEPVRRTTDQSLADWRRVIDVNLQGSFLMARTAARAMTVGRRGGAIVNVASVAGLLAMRASNAYGVSKAAVVMLTQTLAADLASRGIRVNAVAPGIIETRMAVAMFAETGLPAAAFQRRIPMARLGQPEEVARAAVFLASDWASYITGVVLPVDGGWCAFGGAGDASRAVGSQTGEASSE